MYSRSEKGITLIALVITIIVLLIISGVSISAVTGDNGLLTRSDTAKVKTEQAGILEQLRLKMFDKKTEDIEQVVSNIGYLKSAGYIKEDFKEGDEDCYVINPEQLNPVPSTGKGTREQGDVYYLKSGDLYYINSKNESSNLGGVYKETLAIEDDIFEYADAEETNIIGIKEKYIEVIYRSSKGKGKDVNIVKEGKTVTEVTIPSRVTRISDYVFADCINLESVTISGNITYIGKYAFSRCSSLRSIELPSSLVTIGAYAFANCTNLMRIDIPASVTRIDTRAFYNDTRLSTVEYMGNKDNISFGSDVFMRTLVN